MLECKRPILDATQAQPDSVTANQLQALVINTLDEVKAQDVRVFDVTGKTSVTDHMVIASGTSSRHVKTIADHLVASAKQAGFRPLGVEGTGGSDWVLVDLADVVRDASQGAQLLQPGKALGGGRGTGHGRGLGKLLSGPGSSEVQALSATPNSAPPLPFAEIGITNP